MLRCQWGSLSSAGNLRVTLAALLCGPAVRLEFSRLCQKLIAKV